jgi:outer membrane protein assembly factor BamB
MFSPRLFSSCALLALMAPAFAGNWPAWRGPAGDGVTTETKLPLTWSATENVRWKVALPEPGNSSPIVWGDRIFVTQAVGPRRTLMCFDRKDGKVRWQEGPTWSEPERTHQTNPYAASTPVTDGERVIAWFGSAGLWCWDLDGKELWHVDLGKQDHEWGYGASPILHGNLCILNFGPGERSFLVAVDKATGKEVWRFEVPPAAKLEGPGSTQNYIGSWATPIIIEIDGKKQLVIPLPGAVFALDPQTGKELWHCNGLNPLAYADALLVDGVVLGLGGFNGYILGVKPGGSGDVTATHRLWLEMKSPQRLGSSVAAGGHAFLPSDAGIVQCLDPKTGKIVWQERPKVPSGQAQSWSSLVLSGDRIYLTTKGSDTVVFKAAPQFEQLAVNALDDGMTNATPAVSDGQIFIRTHRHLWCIGAP